MDYLVTRRLLIGLGLQVDWMEMDAPGGGAISGYGLMAGPYLTARLADGLYLDARGAWGRSWNEVSPFGTYTDPFDAERWLVTGALIGVFDMGRFNVQPEARLSWFSETSEQYVDSLGVTIPSMRVSTGTLEFGPTISTRMALQNGLIFSPHLKVSGIWTFEQENTATAFTTQLGLAEEGLRGRSEVGFGLSGDGGGTARASVFYDGIGDRMYESWGMKLLLEKQF